MRRVYAPGDVAMALRPIAVRSRPMDACSCFRHVPGSSSPQRASASSSVVTGRPARSTSAESTARSLGLSVTPSRVSGPNTTTLMLRIVRRSAPPVNDMRIPRIPTAYRPRAGCIPRRRSVEP